MNVSAVTNHFPTANKGFITTLGSTILSGATTVPLTSVSGLTNGTVFVGIIEPGQAKEQEFTGTVDTAGVQITGVKWTDGSDVDHTAGVTIVDYVAATGQNMQTKGLLVAHDQDGTLKADSVDVTAVIKDAIITRPKLATAFADEIKGGWLSGDLPAVSSVTHNGNRSYDVVFASTVASTLSEGMRLQFTKTVAGNGYMGGAFNGSSQYFTKTTPSGTLGTVTNNFTIEAVVQPTSYAAGGICGRSDAALNNGFYIQMLASGQVEIGIRNAGVGNWRYVSTYQSLPLNKKTHVAASWTSGTIVIYFDGVAVPMGAVSASGTNPTVAGTGGDFSIGRIGALGVYFPGYISNVAVFDAVLTAATIRQHATYKLTGSETNCIGAWSLDNTANDQSSAGNNLTATGGVGYTAMTPHGQLGNGVETTKAVGLVMAVSTTDVTVQVPEGCTIPTTGGVTSVAYSTQANPYGWVGDKGRWELVTYNKTLSTQSSPVNSTWYFSLTAQLTVPVGKWTLSYFVDSQQSGTAGASDLQTTLTTSTSAETSNVLTSHISFNSAVGNSHFTKTQAVSLASQTPYYLLTRTTMGLGSNTLYNRGDQAMTIVQATPSSL